MRELAARSGVSPSAISLIERDHMSPSVDTLSAVLSALGSTMSAFFDDLVSEVPYSPFYKADELVEIGRSDRVSHRLVGINHPNRRLLLLHERYVPHAATEATLSHAAEEAGIVTRGAVDVTVTATAVFCTKATHTTSTVARPTASAMYRAGKARSSAP